MSMEASGKALLKYFRLTPSESAATITTTAMIVYSLDVSLIGMKSSLGARD